MITRSTMFVLLLIAKGITGWTFSSVPVALRSPTPMSQLPSRGKLIKLEIGFCVCFASSEALGPAGAWAPCCWATASDTRSRIVSPLSRTVEERIIIIQFLLNETVQSGDVMLPLGAGRSRPTYESTQCHGGAFRWTVP